jgi:uncharacterized protein (DUF924 family)
MSTDRVNAILDFWFEGVDDATPINKNALPFRKWFAKTPGLDEDIRQQFVEDLREAADGEYKGWEETARGRLALVLLFDQFSRNIYRGTEQMYAYDALALELVLRAMHQGKEHDLPLIYQVFLYMPLMHFEDVEMQRLSVENFKRLVKESQGKDPDNTHYYEYSLKYAQEHHDTVVKFGRFPHRDVVLKRSFG